MNQKIWSENKQEISKQTERGTAEERKEEDMSYMKASWQMPKWTIQDLLIQKEEDCVSILVWCDVFFTCLHSPALTITSELALTTKIFLFRNHLACPHTQRLHTYTSHSAEA